MNMMNQTLKLGLATSTLFSLSVLVHTTSAAALSITGLYTTGVDNAGNVLADGAVDPHYTILETGTSAITVDSSSRPGSWFPNSSTSGWVWENATGQPTNTTRTFRTTFDLTGLDASTASLSGTWLADNFGKIVLNGQDTGNSATNFFLSPSAFSINAGFVSGINTLDFVVEDVGVISGFRVETISGTADPLHQVPTPAAILPVLTGLFGTAARRQNQEQNS